ncbi:class I SAM-dependent methyltransferase [Parapedobacter tibetensis]|uniref:class I SAM-dependent methyltransferase n=1 Tax=Parapedobacter tibetensis TaxID=2972951 RepID=UPI00214D651C|nr:class I SAM-dependent methyltransferase [Parapedobacter tibetensis]
MAHDVLGNALSDYLHGIKKEQLLIHASYGIIEVMPMEEYFRQPPDFPELEHIAVALCEGNVLDVGAGAGSHALYLQSLGMEVEALEISPKACAVMKERGVRRVIQHDFFEYRSGKYDTLLFLMNGIGIAGSLDGLKKLLRHCKSLLNAGGQLLFDSSDIAYLYADGAIEKPQEYYGQIHYQYEYKGLKSPLFNWLFIDQKTLIQLAHADGWVVQVVYEDGNDQYLVRMELPA